MTDTFRWFESTATGLNLNPGAILEKTGGVIGDLARRVQQPAPDGGSSDMLEEEKPDIDVVSLPGHTYGLAGKVVKVADGDTLTLVDAEGKRVKIRLFGIDTPERDQPYYNRAKSALSRLVANKTVDVDIKDIDSYGRTVGVGYVKGRSINLKMVRLGHTVVSWACGQARTPLHPGSDSDNGADYSPPWLCQRLNIAAYSIESLAHHVYRVGKR